MPRPLRVTIANIPFHILNRGNNRQAVFKDENDFDYFIDLLLRFKKRTAFQNLPFLFDAESYSLCDGANH